MAWYGIGRFLARSRPVESILPPSATLVSCSVAQAAMTPSFAVFSMGWQKHEPNAIVLSRQSVILKHN